MEKFLNSDFLNDTKPNTSFAASSSIAPTPGLSAAVAKNISAKSPIKLDKNVKEQKYDFIGNNDFDKLLDQLKNNNNSNVSAPTDVMDDSLYSLYGIKINTEKSLFLKKSIKFIIAQYSYIKNGSIIEETTKINLNNFILKLQNDILHTLHQPKGLVSYDIELNPQGMIIYLKIKHKKRTIEEHMHSKRIFLTNDQVFKFMLAEFLQDHSLFEKVFGDVE
ncbi:MAG: hypothetical protein LBH55_01430 [Mycoplasmataceae bacterium]|jgi:hypothetical protein|nr:hypothetical protein [Mycoplasmataceae bacterium]